MPAKTFKMTAAGKAELEKELEALKTEGRIDIAEKLKVARSYGDLSENSEYDEAKSEQAKIEARITELEYQIDHAEIIDIEDADAVSIGKKVTVKRLSDGAQAVYEIVGFAQSDPANGKISDESPVGKALVGAKAGETVTFTAAEIFDTVDENPSYWLCVVEKDMSYVNNTATHKYVFDRLGVYTVKYVAYDASDNTSVKEIRVTVK